MDTSIGDIRGLNQSMGASNSPTARLEQEYDRLEAATGSDISDDTADTILGTVTQMDTSTTTQATYCRCLRLLAKYADTEFTTYSPSDMNKLLYREAAQRNWADKTLAQYQSAAKKFAEFQGYSVDNVDIVTTEDRASIDPRTVLEADEFHRLRDETTHPRDTALIDLFGYTGQRVRAIQSLRVRDVDPDSGVYFLPEVEGLKGADDVGKKRPLLGARKSVGEWLQKHPTGEPDDAFITALPNGGPNGVCGDELSRTQIAARIQTVADRARINKPVNPHAFRHFFVTLCKVEYDMDDGTIKHLIGHSARSKIMETTYAHLSDDDHIDDARRALGLESDDDTEPLTPPICPTCSRPLPNDVGACPTPTCNEVFSPDTDLPDESGEFEEQIEQSDIDELMDMHDRLYERIRTLEEQQMQG